MIKLETERLLIRNWQENDAESIFEACKEEELGFWCGFPKHRSIEDSKEVLNKIFLGKKYAFAICLKSENERVIGSIELKFGDNTLACSDEECELGYWLNKKYWGKGYVTEAAEEVLRFAFEELHIVKVWAGYYEGNEGSKRVQEKLGFVNNSKCDNVYVKNLDEYRVGYDNVLTLEKWKEIKND